MKPTRYELILENGVAYLRGYAKETARGYFNVEAIRKVTGKSFPGLRAHGETLAKHFGVEFHDRTVTDA